MNITIKSNSFKREIENGMEMITGIIFLSDDDYHFPDYDWNDTVLFVLNFFLTNLLKRVSKFEVLYMEVPCEVHITVNYEKDNIHFVFLDRRKREIEHESDEILSVFIKNLSKELNGMIRNNTVLNDDEIDKYNKYLTGLQKIYKDQNEKLY